MMDVADDGNEGVRGVGRWRMARQDDDKENGSRVNEREMEAANTGLFRRAGRDKS